MVSKLALTHTPDPIQPTRRGPDPIRSTSRVLTLTDSRPLHCLYRTDAITLYCAVNTVSCGVVGAVFLYTAPASWLEDMRTLKYRIYRRPPVLTHWWLSGHRLNAYVRIFWKIEYAYDTFWLHLDLSETQRKKIWCWWHEIDVTGWITP